MDKIIWAASLAGKERISLKELATRAGYESQYDARFVAQVNTAIACGAFIGARDAVYQTWDMGDYLFTKPRLKEEKYETMTNQYRHEIDDMAADAMRIINEMAGDGSGDKGLEFRPGQKTILVGEHHGKVRKNEKQGRQ